MTIEILLRIFQHTDGDEEPLIEGRKKSKVDEIGMKLKGHFQKYTSESEPDLEKNTNQNSSAGGEGGSAGVSLLDVSVTSGIIHYSE